MGRHRALLRRLPALGLQLDLRLHRLRQHRPRPRRAMRRTPQAHPRPRRRPAPHVRGLPYPHRQRCRGRGAAEHAGQPMGHAEL